MTAQGVPMTLVDFARKERRRDCAVCQLPAEIRTQMLAASDRKIKRAVVMDWLKQVHGVAITDEALTVHYSGHHDAA